MAGTNKKINDGAQLLRNNGKGNLKNTMSFEEMQELFNHIRRNRKKIIDRTRSVVDLCLAIARNDEAAGFPENITESLRKASVDERNYAASSAYALLIGDQRRKELSAYFTPPALASAALEAAKEHLERRRLTRVLDPACGGGSFLAPMARQLVEASRSRGVHAREACSSALKQISGIEIDPGLSKLAEGLLFNALETEFGYDAGRTRGVVTCADALSVEMSGKYDLVIGNPPYGKVRNRISKEYLAKVGLANLGGHTNLYSLFLLRSLDWVRPGGGLVFVLPPSFVAGPYFSGLRQELMKRAQVKSIDLHEQRENLFLGAVQDICLINLKVHDTPMQGEVDHSYRLGLIDANGKRLERGWGSAKTGGEPWTLPVASKIVALGGHKSSEPSSGDTFVLADYGYRVRVGKVVPTRERDSLHVTRKKGDLPLIWASCIRPDGSFDFHAPRKLGNAPWYAAGASAMSCFTTRPSVIVQRTSNRDQKRILNATAVPRTFREKHRKGFAAENHVIVIEALHERPRVGISIVARLINSAIVNERFLAVSGSFSVSATLLRRLALPDPKQVQALRVREFDRGLSVLFSGLEQVLAPSEVARHAQNAVDQTRDLGRGAAINKNSRLKRRPAA